MNRRKLVLRSIPVTVAASLSGCAQGILGIEDDGEQTEKKETANQAYEAGYSSYREGESSIEEGDEFYDDKEWSKSQLRYTDAVEELERAELRFSEARNLALEVDSAGALEIVNDAIERTMKIWKMQRRTA